MARMVLDTGDLMRLLRATVIGARVDGRIRGRIYLCSPILIPEATTRLQRRGSPYIPANSAGRDRVPFPSATRFWCISGFSLVSRLRTHRRFVVRPFANPRFSGDSASYNG